VSLRRSAIGHLHAALAACVLCLLLGALPDAAANADPGPPADTVALPAGGLTALATGELVTLLGEAPLGSGVALSALEPAVLAKLLFERPGISAFAAVTGLGGGIGVEHTIEAAFVEMAGEGDELEELLGERDFSLDLEEQLEATYEASAAGKKAGAPEFEEAAEAVLMRTPAAAIDEGLKSLDLDELLGLLLAKAHEPSRLAGALFAAVEPTPLEELLGSPLSAGPFAQSTVAEAATAIGISEAQLVGELGESGELAAGRIVLSRALANGQALGVFDATDGLAFGLIGKAPATGGGKTEPGGGALPAPVTAGTGTVTTTNTVTAPPASPTTTPPPAAPFAIVAHSARGSVVTLVLEIPAAGVLTVHGRGLRSLTRTITHATRLSIRLGASPAGIATLRRHHRLSVSVLASLRLAGGAVTTRTIRVKLS